MSARHLALALATGISFAACGGHEPTRSATTGLPRVTPDVAVLAVGDTARFRAAVVSAAGDTLGAGTVRWSVADPSVASVDGSGLVRGLSAGSTRVVARVGGAADDTTSVGVTVIRRVARLTVSGLPDSLWVGASFRLFAMAVDSAGAPVAEAPIVWGSSDSSVASVDETGVITVRRWGDVRISLASQRLQLTIPAVVRVKEIGAGTPWAAVAGGVSGYDCAISTAGTPYCWGTNASSRLGSTVFVAATPQAVPVPGPVTALSLSQNHACAVAADGSAWCWGSNSYGQLGQGVAGAASPTPLRVQLTSPVRGVNAFGHSATCVIARDDGVPFCFGHNDWYQLGRPLKAGDPAVAPGFGGIPARVVSGSNFTTCLVALDGSAWCAGGWGGGVLGDGELEPVQSPPVRVDGTQSWQTVATGEGFSCALTTAGEPYCWGYDYQGRLGLGDDTVAVYATPRPVAGGLRFAAIGAGFYHACGLTTGGAVYCWGANPDGRLGSHASDSSAAPIRVDLPMTFRALALGDDHTCAITTSDRLYCWGGRFTR